MKKIIIFGPGMVNTLGMIRSCGEKGLSVHLLIQGKKSSNNYVRFSRYISKIYYLPADDDFLGILYREYWNEKEKIAILCGGDDAVSLLDKHYVELKDRFLFFNCGEQNKINFYLDKINQFAIAEKAGLTLIRTWKITDVHKVPEDIIFPCLTKGSNSTKSTKSDMHICHSREELLECLNDGTEYLVQEFIEKEYELNCVCMAYNQGNKIIAPCVIRKVRDDIGRQSVYFRTDNYDNYPDFDYEILTRVAKALRYEGIFSVEVIYSKGKYYFLEINLRNDGCGYLYTEAGCNYPYLWNLYATGNLTDEIVQRIHTKIPTFMMSEQDLRNMFERKVKLYIWVKQFFTCDAFYILSMRDPIPFIYSNLIHIKQYIKRIFGMPLV